MKFGIGLESMMGYNTYFDANNEPGVTGVEALVADNLFNVESSEYIATIESIGVDIDVALGQSRLYGFGTEAEDDKKEDKPTEEKKAWYKRLWDAIVKMFKTIGGWFSSAWKWIKKKFGFGGDNDVTETSKELVKGQLEGVEKSKEFVESGHHSKEEIKEESKKLILNALNKNKRLIKATGLIEKIAEQLSTDVSNAVVEGQNQTLDVKKIKVTFYTFNTETLKRFSKYTAKGKLSEFDSAINNFPSSFENEEAFVSAGKKLSAFMLLASSYMLNILFGDDTVGTIDPIVVTILTSPSKQETSNTVDDYNDFEAFFNRVKEYGKKISNLAQSQPTIKFDEIRVGIPLGSNGVISKDDAFVNRLLTDNKEGADNSMARSRELTNFIIKVTDACSKASTKITSSLNSYDNIKHEFNDLTDYRTRRVKLMKDSLMEIKNIGKVTIDILGKQNMNKISQMEMKYKQLSSSDGLI